MSKVCVIIPCYNEGTRLNVKAFSDFISDNGEDISVLFVNDGSKDNTLQVLQSIQKEFTYACYILDLARNSGKAEAVRQGVLMAYQMGNVDYVAYFDADLATPLEELLTIKSIIEHKTQMVMVLCSRIKRLGATINRKFRRHILGRIFSTFSSIILKLPVYDTQCGAKLIKTQIIPEVFGEPFITSWLFDVEVIARIRNLYPDSIGSILYEYPVVKWADIGDSKLKLKHMIKVPLELYKIHKEYN